MVSKDFWQERRHYVANTRWWPPFCAAIDWLVAVVLVIETSRESNYITSPATGHGCLLGLGGDAQRIVGGDD